MPGYDKYIIKKRLLLHHNNSEFQFSKGKEKVSVETGIHTKYYKINILEKAIVTDQEKAIWSPGTVSGNILTLTYFEFCSRCFSILCLFVCLFVL